MAGYNRVIIVGNLTRDPEYKQLASGQAVSRLSVASNRQFKNRQSGDLIQEVCYVDVDVWGAQAENCRQYLQKGRSILVEGRLKFDSWEDQNGQSRSKLSIVADRVIFLASGQETFEGATRAQTEPGSSVADSGRFDVQSDMERELFEQIERLKNKEPKISSKKKKETELISTESSQTSDESSEFTFKDEPPFQDDLPF